MKTELERLQERIAQIKFAQAHCDHEWGQVEYDPDKREITREELVNLGLADSYYKTVATGMFEKVDRWSRVCNKCGKKEYSYEQEEIAIETIKRPKF